MSTESYHPHHHQSITKKCCSSQLIEKASWSVLPASNSKASNLNLASPKQSHNVDDAAAAAAAGQGGGDDDGRGDGDDMQVCAVCHQSAAGDQTES